jgi:2-C-methyl-D-erythritol 4-phosphate cytidylyltransferase
MNVAALILAAGQGKRMGAEKKKPYLLLAGKPILFHTLGEFEKCPSIDGIVLVVEKQEVGNVRTSIVDAFGCRKVINVVPGGPKRQDSVWEGIKALKGGCELVMVHDSVRPFISPELLEKAVDTTRKTGATVVAVPVKDTIKAASPEKEVVKTLDRETLWAVQTPQTFNHDLLKKAHEKARQDGFYGTDDASLVERIGVPVSIIDGSYENIKITTPEDLVLAEALLQKR